MKRILTLCLFALLAACGSTPAVTDMVDTPDEITSAVPNSTELDGKTFAVTVKDQKEEKVDMLIFTDGEFLSTDCQQYGFVPTKYTASTTAGLTTFQAKATSAVEGEMAWTGQINGDGISGTAIWTKEGQNPITYAFEGKTAPADPATDGAPAPGDAEATP